MRQCTACFTILLVALILGQAGCGSKTPTYPAGGKVTFADGSPLTSGFVIFRSLDDPQHPSARGSLQASGEFELSTFADGDGAVLGKHQVLISTPPAGGRPGVGPPPGPQVDARFSGYETSGLEFTVGKNASENRFDIVVKKGG
jgi:hypothetical protein